MKKNLIIAIAAGVAVAGLAGYLLGTDSGRKLAGKWRKKGQKLTGELEGMIREGRSRLADLGKEMMDGCQKQESTAGSAKRTVA